VKWCERVCRPIVRERSGGICEICGALRASEQHHRRNRSQGGQWQPSNILDLCSADHKFITEHPAMAVRNGWSIQGTTSVPSETPCRRRNELVLLQDDGSFIEEAA
jgi:hypothetical protein